MILIAVLLMHGFRSRPIALVMEHCALPFTATSGTYIVALEYHHTGGIVTILCVAMVHQFAVSMRDFKKVLDGYSVIGYA